MNRGLLPRFCFFVYILVYTWLITNGDFNLFKNEGYAFDSLSTSLLNFNCSVENSIIGWEAFIVNNKSYMYFGPFPAILRIILNFFFPALLGKWSVLSCISSSMLCMLGFSILTIMVLKDNDNLSKELKYFFFFVSQLTFAFGTPIFYLISNDSIFHESILWALAFGIFGIVYLYKLINQTVSLFPTFFLFSTCVGLSFLSKVSYGMPLYIIWIAYIARLVISSKQPILKLLIASSPACLALIYQLWYNFCRFGNVLTFINYKYYYPWILYPSEYERFQKIGILNFRRIPISLFNYLGLRTEYFSLTPPFFNFSLPKLSVPSIFMNYQEHVISLTVVSLFFIAISIIGLFWMIREKKYFFTKFCALSFLGQIIFILSFSFGITHRYSADFIPFLVFMYTYFMSKIGNRTYLAIGKSAKFVVISTIFFSLFSMVATVFSTLGEVRKVYFIDFLNFTKTILNSIYEFLF